jgi:hypothetical protein
MRRLLAGALLLAGAPLAVCGGASLAQAGGGAAVHVDSDRDGLSDGLESVLLARFAPEVLVSSQDCSVMPGEFLPNTETPYVLADNGTMYGQASPAEAGAGVRKASAVQGNAGAGAKKASAVQGKAGAGAKKASAGSVTTTAGSVRRVELHYYLLWRADCGRMGHALDAEHVSALVEGEGEAPEGWRALYWYAAAHEDTVCDASQLTRASTIDAEEHGARVWVSSGKHSSFLNRELCRRGCGGDRCDSMKRVPTLPVINLGEPRAPMNGAAWARSSRWPLEEKMERSDFTAVRLARLEALPETDVAWAEPSKRPAQAAVRGGNAGVDGALVGGTSTADALGLSSRKTNTAIVVANNRTSAALDSAAQNTGKALTKSASGVRGAMGNAWKHTGGALGTKKDTKDAEPDSQRAEPDSQ